MIPASLDPAFNRLTSLGVTHVPKVVRKTFYGPFRRPWFRPLRSVLEETRNQAESFINNVVGHDRLVSVSENVIGGRLVVTVWYRDVVTEPKLLADADDLG